MRLFLPFFAGLTLCAQAVVLDKRDLVSDIWNDIKNAVTCEAAQGVIGVLKGVAELGDRVFVEILTGVCKLSNAEDDDVCEGAIALEGPIVAEQLRDMSLNTHTSYWFAVTFLGLCAYPKVIPYNVTFSSPKPASQRPQPSSNPPLKIVHYSDIHIDPFYVTGSTWNCTKPICCRPYEESDEPGNTDTPAGPNGNHKCDVPHSLEESMYDAIKSIVPDAAFVIFTGDIVDHAIWNTTRPQNTININDAYSRMGRLGKTIYPVAGNHEASPTNAFPPTALNRDDQQWVLDLLSSDWQQWIGSTGASSTKSFGGYSTKYSNTSLRIISLNTNLYYVDNYWLYSSPMDSDPSGQLTWLAHELAAAETSNERVYLIGHMPFGLPDAFRDTSAALNTIVTRYSATIAGMFFGHTHADEFEISYADYATPRDRSAAIAVQYLAPSLTPTDGMPAFRVYDVDPLTWAVLDHTTYIADMTDPAFQTTGPVWKEYYSAREAYGGLVGLPEGAELSAAFWHNVTVAMQEDDKAFQGYWSRKTRGYNVAACTGDCKTSEICQMQAGDSSFNCVVPKIGVHFGKRDESFMGTGGSDVHDCGVSILRKIGRVAANK